jgi:outer membrane protein assembly factor BamB
MKKSSLLITLLIALFFIGSLDSPAQDWPQWRGLNRDGKVTGFKAPKAWPKELTQVWKVNVGFGDATPVLAGKNIFLSTRQGSDEVILCLNASTGKELWKIVYPAPTVTGPAGSHPGPRSTPSFSNGKIVTFGVSGILSCLDAVKGKLLWRKENPTNALPTFFTGMSPLITDGMCIAYVGKKDSGAVIAYDMITGNERWKWTGEGPAYSSPSVMTVEGKKILIVISEKNIMALGLSDGKLLWQIPATVQQRFYNSVSPYVDGQTIVYSGQGLGSKALKVEKKGEMFTAREIWANPEVGAKWNTPILKNGHYYGFTDTRKIYCLNAITGKTAWIDNTVNSDFSTIVDCGTVIIGLASTGNLIVLKPDEKAYTELAKYKVSETPIYAYPIISGKNIYIKDAESLIMYKVK